LILPAPASAHGDLHDQIAAVTREIALHPRGAGLYLKRGELHRFHGETAAALEDYSRASRLDPSLAEADFGRGRALLEANRARAARLALVRFVNLRPNHAEGRLALARCLVKLARWDDAAAEYSRAIALLSNPTPDAYVERARALASAGRTTEAIHGLDEGITRLGRLVALVDVAIRLEVERNNWDGALVRLDRIAALFARRETWFARRGEILDAAGRRVEAQESFEAARRAIEALPPGSRRTRAMVRLERKVRMSLEHLESGSTVKETTDAKS
jgi:tetratricopeptide (TPR) repeat protein